MLLTVIFLIALISKLVGCGTAAYARGMGTVRSFRVGCGMMSRGEVGLIVTAMGASYGIFRQPEVAVMVTVVLVTTLLTPLALRGAFNLKCAEDDEDMFDGRSIPIERRPAAQPFSDSARNLDDLGKPMHYATPDSGSRSIGVT